MEFNFNKIYLINICDIVVARMTLSILAQELLAVKYHLGSNYHIFIFVTIQSVPGGSNPAGPQQNPLLTLQCKANDYLI